LEINSSSIPSTKKTFREAVIRGKTIRCYRVAASKDQSNEPQSFPKKTRSAMPEMAKQNSDPIGKTGPRKYVISMKS